MSCIKIIEVFRANVKKKGEAYDDMVRVVTELVAEETQVVRTILDLQNEVTPILQLLDEAIEKEGVCWQAVVSFPAVVAKVLRGSTTLGSYGPL